MRHGVILLWLSSARIRMNNLQRESLAPDDHHGAVDHVLVAIAHDGTLKTFASDDATSGSVMAKHERICRPAAASTTVAVVPGAR